MKKRIGTCTEDVFWECIEEMRWSADADYDLIKARCLRAWTPEFGVSFGVIASIKANLVRDSIITNQEYIGDDSRSDIAYHVVGLGKEVFDAEVGTPELLVRRANAYDYKESFSYAIPHAGRTKATWDIWVQMHRLPTTQEDFEEWAEGREFIEGTTLEEATESFRAELEEFRIGDWAYIQSGKYVRWAKKYARAVQGFIEALESETSRSNKEEEGLGYALTVDSYLKLLIEEKTEEALALSERALASWWGLVFIGERLGIFRTAHRDLLPQFRGEVYGGENLINDHRVYMGGLEKFRCQHHLELLIAAHKGGEGRGLQRRAAEA